MSGRPGAIAARVAALERAIAAPEGAPLAVAIPMPAQTALVLDPGLGEAAWALGALAAALARQGIPPGRLDVVVASGGDPDRARVCGRAAGEALGVGVVHVHDPERSTHFPAGVLDGVGIELADVLRESEAVIVVEAAESRARWRVLVPGLASAATARSLARAGVDPAATRDAVLALVPVSWVVGFARDTDRPAVRAGTPSALWGSRRAS